MFFIGTISKLVKNYRTSRKARRLSIERLNNYFDIGQRVHDALLAAEEVMGSAELGISQDDVKISDDGVVMTAKYKVDDELTTTIQRSFNDTVRRRLGRKSVVVYTLHFVINDVVIKFSPDVYSKLAERTITSIYERVKDYGHRADVNLAGYMAKHYTNGVPNEQVKVAGKRSKKRVNVKAEEPAVQET